VGYRGYRCAGGHESIIRIRLEYNEGVLTDADITAVLDLDHDTGLCQRLYRILCMHRPPELSAAPCQLATRTHLDGTMDLGNAAFEIRQWVRAEPLCSIGALTLPAIPALGAVPPGRASRTTPQITPAATAIARISRPNSSDFCRLPATNSDAVSPVAALATGSASRDDCEEIIAIGITQVRRKMPANQRPGRRRDRCAGNKSPIRPVRIATRIPLPARLRSAVDHKVEHYGRQKRASGRQCFTIAEQGQTRRSLG